MTTMTQAHDLIVIGGSAAATGNGQVRLTVETPRAGDFTVTAPQLGRAGLTEAKAWVQGGQRSRSRAADQDRDSGQWTWAGPGQ